MTTSATGISGGTPERSGFTLIELLMVITLILFLMALIVSQFAKQRREAQIKKTQAFIEILDSKLGEYYSLTGSLPPDGIDSEVKSKESATLLQSGAALTVALTQEVLQVFRDGGGSERFVPAPALLTDVPADDFYVPDPDDPDVKEILDVWGNPFHYDALPAGVTHYSVQSDATVHLQPLATDGVHHGDPREAVGVAVKEAGAQNPKKFDIWSHGPNGHEAEEVPEEVIGNWPKPAPAKKGE